jgi:hypothetical protein
LPTALERGGGSLPLAKAITHAGQKNRAPETLAFANGLADAPSSIIAEIVANPQIFPEPQILPHPQVFADSKVLTNSEVLANPETHSGSET